MKLADEVKRLETVARTPGLIAMRFQQIAKELHIELVVLHDQDGFRHPSPPIPAKRARINRERYRPKPPWPVQCEFGLAPEFAQNAKSERLFTRSGVHSLEHALETRACLYKIETI